MRQFSSILVAAILCVVGISGVGTSPAHGQQTKIPKDLLEVDRQRCMRGCVPGYGETTCKPLCDCTVEEFDKRFDFERYLDVAAELAKNEIGPETRKILDTIGNLCADKIEKAGIQIGEPPKKPASEPPK